ncbi:UPF0177 protein yvdC [Lactococcus fujiensis JCM 16395]|uniref:UPF0177 protein yvdC n=3 Tax=Lactococcus fujiensis TaxID=610251 RepID=A0A2A5RKS3_9LACT|nr:UPF0177 protein yvdC [Lactococcus fujiensis JCM 16395]
MNNTHLEQLKKWRWLICLPFVLLFAYLFSPHTFSVFLLTVAVLYIIALLFLYGRASWLLFFGLSLLPMVTTSLILNFHKKFNLLDILVFMALFSISLVFSYLLARKKQLIQAPKRRNFPLGKILIGLLTLFAFSLFSSMIGKMLHSTGTVNQDALNELRKVIPIGIFAIQTIFAGFFEELTYRVAIFELVFKKQPKIAFIVACLLFAYMHGPTNVYSWLVYGSMSFTLTTIYAKYRNFYLNMSIHMLWNAIGIVAALLV